jgi:hypothetical protein
MAVSVEEQGKALAASELLANALAEVLRFAREGEMSPAFAFADDTISFLAEALAIAAELEAPRLTNPERQFEADADGAEQLGQLIGACRRFIEGWRQ